MEILLKDIVTNPDQPRKRFDQKKLEELAQSIREQGLIQPISVEDVGDGTYLLVAGERRFRAHVLLGRERIDAAVKPLSNHNGRERYTKAFVENVQREEMNVMETSNGYKALLDQLGSVAAVCQQVGKSDATVYSYLSLQAFEPEIKKLFEYGTISMDPKVIAALNKLSSDQRVQVATRAAVRGATASTLIRMCALAGAAAGRPRGSRTEKVNIPAGQHFTALAMLKTGVGLPFNVQEAARSTCESCELYDMAGPNTCRECPLVDFLRKMKAD